jgi:hypothetical protein
LQQIQKWQQWLEAQRRLLLQHIQQTTAVKGVGVLHWDGSFIARKVLTMDDVKVSFETPKGLSLSTVNTATVFFSRLSFAQALELRGKKPGVLLASGDFVEGNLKSLTKGTVVVDSVLFGRKSYQVGTEAMALWLREPNLVATNVLSRAWEKVDKASAKEKAKLLGKVKLPPYLYPGYPNLGYPYPKLPSRRSTTGRTIESNWRGGI